MGTIQSLNKTRLLALEAATIVDGYVNDDGDLILIQHDTTEVNAGNVIGPTGELPNMNIAYMTAASAPSTYPLGLSYMNLPGTVTDWPVITAVVLTVRYGSNRTWQQAVVKISGKVWVRAETDGDAWGVWTELTAAASSTLAGIQMNATSAEALALTVANKTITPATLAAVVAMSTPPGIIAPYTGINSPTGWFICDGRSLDRTTYAALFAATNTTMGVFTVTIASPGVFTRTAHGGFTGQQVALTTTGALPTGLTAETNYWLIRIDANTFRLATSLANALAGTAINTSGSQSGGHTIRRTFGVGNGTTTFNIPNLSGRVVVGIDTAQTEFDVVGETGGAKTHSLTIAEMPAHTHALTGSNGGAVNNSLAVTPNSNGDFALPTPGARAQSAGGDGAHNNLQPYMALYYIIKT